MIDFSKLEDAAGKLSGLLPEGPRAVGEDLRRNLRPLLESGLARMDLVTREEFDAQTRVLERTREKLEALERVVAELEQRQGDNQT